MDARKVKKAQRRMLMKEIEIDNKSFTDDFVKVSDGRLGSTLKEAFRNKRFLVQKHHTPFKNVKFRLSINRTSIKEDGSWQDRITWDEIQDIKSKLGYSDYQAIEIYPPEDDLVNVANIRHIWILREPLDITLNG